MKITDKDRKNKYKKLKKYKDTDAFIDDNPTNDLERIFIKAFNEKNLNKRYELVYDYMFDYVDKNFCKECDFKDNKCIANRLKKSSHDKDGCCYLYNKGVCKYLVNKKCTRPNISCKLFMCDYLERKILKFKSVPKNYFLFNFFFNRNQMNIIQRSYGKSKNEILKDLQDNK